MSHLAYSQHIGFLYNITYRISYILRTISECAPQGHKRRMWLTHTKYQHGDYAPNPTTHRIRPSVDRAKHSAKHMHERCLCWSDAEHGCDSCCDAISISSRTHNGARTYIYER